MRKLFTVALATTFLFSSLASCAQQQDKSKRPSPPATATGTAKGGATIKIDYSQPSVKGRKVWGGIVPYGEVWRTGANEATIFEVSKDVKVEGKPLPAGKYALFTIPGENEWVVIFNKKFNQWGSYEYKQADDALRVTVKPGKAPSMHEQLMFHVMNSKVSMMWENLKIEFTVE
jgi:Protein of unknown function (DUF2911)